MKASFNRLAEQELIAAARVLAEAANLNVGDDIEIEFTGRKLGENV